MFSRILAAIGLVLTVVFSTGCASSMDYSFDRKADGTVQEKEKSSCVGLFCGTSTARGQASVTIIPMAPAPSYGRYGRDYYNSGPLSYDPRPPVPHVVFGAMLSGSIREAFVNGTRRMCDVRPSAPNYCNRIEDAHGWAIPSERTRR
jgi:hypothetical protein